MRGEKTEGKKGTKGRSPEAGTVTDIATTISVVDTSP